MNSKIYYIDCYNGNVKERNIGFVRLDDEQLFIMLRGIPARSGMDCRLYLENAGKERKEAVTVPVRNGYGQAQCLWPKEMTRQECCSLYIPLYGNLYGKCVLQEMTDKTSLPEKHREVTKPITPFSEELEVVDGDKWKQLCAAYPQIHIFPEADTVVIKPKDMVVLTEEYHALAANSFVLHAYYNYRQLLLLRYREQKQAVYYLGVPGIYYEREKRIAHLFGFEGFENGESRLVNEDRRRAYTGCFGYYMKQVSI